MKTEINSFLQIIEGCHGFLTGGSFPEIFSGERQGLIFVFTDALGSCFLENLRPEAFLRRNRIADVSSVFPTTTPCAMLTCATGTPPAYHGCPGRWSYLRDRDIQVNTLAFAERFSMKTLDSGEVPHRAVWPIPSVFAREDLQRETRFIVPRVHRHTPFEEYFFGNNSITGYETMSGAIDAAVDFSHRAGENFFCFVYLWDLDNTSHAKGPDAPETLEVLHQINSELERLAEQSKRGTRVCITADHGQIENEPRNRLGIFHGDEILDLLITPPFGEPRVPHFLSKEGKQEQLLRVLNDRFGEAFSFSRAEAIYSDGSLEWSGPSEYVRQYHGDVIGLPRTRATLKYYPPGKGPDGDHLGEHGGDDHAENTVPLIIV